MAEYVDYAKLYLQGLTIKNTADQAMFSKRLLEYTMAKDSGEDDLKNLLEHWKNEDEIMNEQKRKWKKIGVGFAIFFSTLGLICIIVELYFAFAVSW